MEDRESHPDNGLSHIERTNLTHKRTWELYIGFILGRPMWTRSQQHSIEEDFRYLLQIYDFGYFDDVDQDAADAAADAIRELVMQASHELQRPLNILYELDFDLDDAIGVFLVHFMICGHSATAFRRWYDAFGAQNWYDDLDSALYGMFKHISYTGERPDMMERCRYHKHGKQTCYLDK